MRQNHPRSGLLPNAANSQDEASWSLQAGSLLRSAMGRQEPVLKSSCVASQGAEKLGWKWRWTPSDSDTPKSWLKQVCHNTLRTFFF